MSKLFAASCLNFLHNYFIPTKLFSDLYPPKFLNISTKSFFRIRI